MNLEKKKVDVHRFRKGMIFSVNLCDHECEKRNKNVIGKFRSCVIYTDTTDLNNESQVVHVIPITKKDFRTSVYDILYNDENGETVSIIVNQIMPVDISEIKKYWNTLSDETMNLVDCAVDTYFGKIKNKKERIEEVYKEKIYSFEEIKHLLLEKKCHIEEKENNCSFCNIPYISDGAKDKSNQEIKETRYRENNEKKNKSSSTRRRNRESEMNISSDKKSNIVPVVSDDQKNRHQVSKDEYIITGNYKPTSLEREDKFCLKFLGSIDSIKFKIDCDKLTHGEVVGKYKIDSRSLNTIKKYIKRYGLPK